VRLVVPVHSEDGCYLAELVQQREISDIAGMQDEIRARKGLEDRGGKRRAPLRHMRVGNERYAGANLRRTQMLR
jgi:hypothetical protein